MSVFESGAILMYLGEKAGKFFPQSSPHRERVLEWLFWQVGGLGPMAGQVSHFVNYAPNFPGDHSYSIQKSVTKMNMIVCWVLWIESSANATILQEITLLLT